MIHPGLLGPLHLDMSRLVSSQPVGFTLRDFKGDSWYIAFYWVYLSLKRKMEWNNCNRKSSWQILIIYIQKNI